MANILIVDDSSLLRRNLRAILEQLGHTIIAEAEDCEEAIQLYKQHTIDLVTMDIQMPGKNGIEAVKLIKEYDSEAKIVMVSSVEQKDLIYEAIKGGAKHYIVKPFTEDKVAEVLQAMLHTKVYPNIPSKKDNAAKAQGSAGSISQANKSSDPQLRDPQANGLPFDVSLSNGRIVVTLYKYVTEQSYPQLITCLQGLLFIQSAKFLVVLEKVAIPQESAIAPFIDFIRIIKNRKGSITVVVEDHAQNMVVSSRLGMEVLKSLSEVK